MGDKTGEGCLKVHPEEDVMKKSGFVNICDSCKRILVTNKVFNHFWWLSHNALLQKFIFYKMQDCLFVRLLSCLAHLLLDLILSELHQRIL